MYRYADGILKNYLSLKQESHNFTAHAWLTDEKLIVGNDRAELFLIQNCEILMEYKLYDIRERERRLSVSSSSNPANGQNEANKSAPVVDSHSVTSIIPYSKGFWHLVAEELLFFMKNTMTRKCFEKDVSLRFPRINIAMIHLKQRINLFLVCALARLKKPY